MLLCCSVVVMLCCCVVVLLCYCVVIMLSDVHMYLLYPDLPKVVLLCCYYVVRCTYLIYPDLPMVHANGDDDDNVDTL
jgi:hypothetical protein